MKQFKYIAAIVLMIVSAAGCREKDNPNVKLPISTELAFSSHAELYNVRVEEDAAWVVKSHPEWATPMQDTGSAGDKIVLFVEDNFEEEERKGEMSVITDKHEIVYTITQNSSLSDDENAEIVSDDILSLTYGVGYGINVFGTPSMGKYKFAGAIVNPANLSKILANVGEADAYCAEDHYFSKTESISGTSTTSLATQLSVNAGIEVEVTGFSGSLNGKFTSDESSNTETAYAMREIKHVVGSRYLRPGILRSLSAENCDSIFAKSFYSLSQSIKKNPSNSDNYIKKLLDNYGTHLVVHGTLGGELELSMEMTSTEKISEMDINAALNLSSDIVNGDASFTMNETETALAKNTKISLKTYGGNNVYTLKPGTTFEEAMQEALSTSQLNNWIASIKDKTSLALIDVQLYPVYDLMPDAASRDAVREYMINKYQVAKTELGPLNFAVSGFGDDGVITGEAYISQIDVKLECYQEMVPEISNDEPSIIIYSGTQDEMNYDRGFFIGSKTLKPGKLRRDREGKYSFEEFEDLEAGQITELYVTADGDIIIAGKPGVAYSEVKFTGATKSDLTDKNLLPVYSGDSDVCPADEMNAIKYINQSCWFWGPQTTKHVINAFAKVEDNTSNQYMMRKGLLNCELIVKASRREITGAEFWFYGNNPKDAYDLLRTIYQIYPQSCEFTHTCQAPNGTAYIRVLMYTETPTWKGGEEWDFVEGPNLRLIYNYDNTPRWK